MAMIKYDSGEFYLDNRLKKELDIYLSACKQDDDFLIIVDGAEGAGKSVLMQQIGYYCAQTLGTKFTTDNIHFTLKEYIDSSITGEFYRVNVLDESRKILNKKASMGKESRKFTNYLSECRKRRQVHIMGLPAYHELDKNVVLWRSKMVIHVLKYFVEDASDVSGYKLRRGDFKVYMTDEYLKKCYLYPYAYPKKWHVKGSFRPANVIDKEAYESKKDDNLFKKYHSSVEEEQLTKREQMWKTRWLTFVSGMRQYRNIKLGEVADLSNMELNTVKTAISRG